MVGILKWLLPIQHSGDFAFFMGPGPPLQIIIEVHPMATCLGQERGSLLLLRTPSITYVFLPYNAKIQLFWYKVFKIR